MEFSKIQMPANDGGADNSCQADQTRERLGAAVRLVDELAGSPQTREGNAPVTDQDIRSIIRYRRHRDHFFGAELFADPAWDMLLHLYASWLSQHRMPVGALCEGAAVPATTALRWLALLERKGLVERRSDPFDGRRQFISLTVATREALDGYFGSVQRGQFPI